MSTAQTLECLLGMVADELGIDPVAIRERNAMDPGTMTINDLDIGSCEFKATLEAVKKKSGWAEKYGKLPPRKRGREIGTHGRDGHATAEILFSRE